MDVNAVHDLTIAADVDTVRDRGPGSPVRESPLASSSFVESFFPSASRSRSIQGDALERGPLLASGMVDKSVELPSTLDARCVDFTLASTGDEALLMDARPRRASEARRSRITSGGPVGSGGEAASPRAAAAPQGRPPAVWACTTPAERQVPPWSQRPHPRWPLGGGRSRLAAPRSAEIRRPHPTGAHCVATLVRLPDSSRAHGPTTRSGPEPLVRAARRPPKRAPAEPASMRIKVRSTPQSCPTPPRAPECRAR